MKSQWILRSLFSLAAFALCGSLALAQPPAQPQTPPASAPAAAAATAPIERHPPSHPAMRHQMMQGRGKMGGNFRNARMNGKENGHEGFGIMPEGMWWKSPMVVQRLTLTPDQVGRMDGIFEKSRIELIDLKANLEKQNVYLEPILSANPTDTAKAMLQIDKVADARADLEKANARMLLGIRSVLTPEQWTKLSAHRGPGKFGGPEGAGAPGGFGPGGFGAGHGPHGPGVNDFVAPDPQF